jgi:hypothetical protein
MSTNFVRYSPEIETFDPKLSEYMTRIIDFWETKVANRRQEEASGRAVRGRPREGRSASSGQEVEILCDAPPPYAQGIYAKPAAHDALIRFLQRLEPPGPGRAARTRPGLRDQDLRRRRDQAGRRRAGLGHVRPRAEEQPDRHRQHRRSTTCSSRRSAIRSATTWRADGRGFHELLAEFVTGKGTLEQDDWAWDELFAFVKAATQTPVRNPLLNTYWTMAAVRHGDYVAKVRVAPAAESAENAIHHELDLSSEPDVFGPTLVDELQAQAFDFDLQVQLCTDLTAMPVSDTTVEWPETLSPFVTVGRVHLPRQDISGPENFEKGDALAFNQWRVTSDHRPLGEIMDVRRVYTASARVRRTLNHQPQREPTGADEVLTLPRVEP